MGAKAINCSQCGGPLEVFVPNAKTCVCPHCSSQLDLTSPNYEFLQAIRKTPVRAPLQVGMMGVHPSAGRMRVVGHLRFQDVRETWFWDEFLVISESGHQMWIQYDDRTFSTYSARRLRSPVHPDTAQSHFMLEGQRYQIRDRGEAFIRYLNGELTWHATLQDRVKWIDAGPIGVEWTEKEIEVFDKQSITNANIQEWFGLEKYEFLSNCYFFNDNDQLTFPNPKLQRNCCIATFGFPLVAFVILALISLFIDPYGYCETDADCVSIRNANICDTSANQCESCLRDEHCSGNQACMPSTYRYGRQYECQWPNTDGDQTPPSRDSDDDNDGLSDDTELGSLNGDSENNGVQDWEDPIHVTCPDVDENGVCDSLPLEVDADGDGLANHLDVDSDGDGVTDMAESGLIDTMGNGRFATRLETTPLDTDGDGIFDYLDTDSDGDTLPDLLEMHDANRDGVADVMPRGSDADHDGLDDAFDPDCQVATCGVAGALPFFASEPARHASVHNPDDDGDGILTRTELLDSGGVPDLDEDGKPSWYDEDSDGDGALDRAEYTAFIGEDGDLNNNDIADYLEVSFAPRDDDGDGIPNRIECPGSCPDTDGDGLIDTRDPDDDNDGALTLYERRSDPDSDGVPAFRDLDSDGDGIFDLWENGGFERDTDHNGIADRNADVNQDGILDIYGEGMALRNSDSDRFPDELDIDSDNDGVSDGLEAESGLRVGAPGGSAAAAPLTALSDIDRNGVYDFQSVDADGDARRDMEEVWGLTTAPEDVDLNGDGMLDRFASSPIPPRDSDSDGLHDYLDRYVPPAPRNYYSGGGYRRGSSSGGGYSYGK